MRPVLLSCLLVASFPGLVLAQRAPHIESHDLSVTLEPERHRLTGTDRMTFREPATGVVPLRLHRGLAILRAEGGGRTLETSDEGPVEGSAARIVRIRLPLGLSVKRLTLAYEGSIHDPVRRSGAVGFVRGDDTSGIISEEGVFLHGGTHWHPRGAETFAHFRMVFRIPEPWRVVTEGELEKDEVKEGTRVTAWESDTPLDGPAVAANRFAVKGRDFDGVRISAYFLPEDARLMDDYIEAAGRYLAFYRELLGPYAYDRFDIVENFFTTGYGMPGFTLLGPRVVKMAHFGSRTLGPHSLGHELVHCWWGNHVFVPRGTGNWCEALTTYCANYYWVERFEGPEKARAYRRKAFLKYSIFVDEENDYPVREFAYKRKETDDFIGYTKGSMVMHTLRGEIGDGPFFAALRRVRREFGGRVARWEDFRRAFEAEADRDLGWFFDRWIDGTGAPSLTLRDVSTVADGEGWIVRARIAQRGEPFRLTVPVVLTTEEGTVRDRFQIGPARDRIALRADAKPLRLEVDPAFEVFRRIHRRAIHPCLELTLAHDSAVAVYPTGGTEAENAFYRRLAGNYQKSSRRIPARADETIRAADLEGRSLLVLGGPAINTVAKRLAPALDGTGLETGETHFRIRDRRFDDPEQSALVSVVHPLNARRHVTFYLANAPESMGRARLMGHYGWDSYLVYDVRKPRQVLFRGNFEAGASPDAVDLVAREKGGSRRSVFGPGEAFAFRYEDGRRMTFEEMVERLDAYDAVFVGEYHNDWATHRAEAGILRGLIELGRRDVAVSMEMFERDVQDVLDRYLASEIDEQTFLKDARPWGNYVTGYRRIVERAKRAGIPVLASNVPRSLASEVARGGREALENLPEAKKALVARKVTTPEGPYKEKFLRTLLGGRPGVHPMAGRFYLAQSLKDDTMAESIADFLRSPGRKNTLVVHYNGSFHSDGHLGTVMKFEKRMPGRKVAVVKIVPVRDLGHADVEAWRRDADFLLAVERRGEDLRSGLHAFQIASRIRFLPVLPEDFDPGRRIPCLVVFHDRGSGPRSALRALKDWGMDEALLVLVEGLHPVWNRDGTPGYGWFSPVRGGEDGDVLATFGAELAAHLRAGYPVDADRVWFLGIGEGALAAREAFAGAGSPEGWRIAAVGAMPGARREAGEAQVHRVRAAGGASVYSDAMGEALRETLGFGKVPAAPLEKERAVVLSVSADTEAARRWGYRIAKDVEKALGSKVHLYTGAGEVGLEDVFLALHLQGVKRIVHQPLTFDPEAVWKPALPDWARDEIEAKVETLPPLAWKEVLRSGVFPPRPQGRMAPSPRFVILVASGEEEDALGRAVRASGLTNVRVVREADGFDAVARALHSTAPTGMPGMMGMAPPVYVLRAGFAAGAPASFLPALYRHGDPNLRIRAGVGCLQLEKVILDRLGKHSGNE